MENIEEIRMLNILKRALSEGFVFDPNKQLGYEVALAEEYLIDTVDYDNEERCNFDSGTYNSGQYYHYEDKNGWSKEETGEITNKTNIGEVDGQKVFYFATVVNSEAEVIRLYDYA